MEIINIEAKAFEELLRKFEEIVQRLDCFVKRQNKEPGSWLDNQEVCLLLNISKRTLQNYRNKGLIAYSQTNNKIYYKPKDVETFINRLRK